MPVIWGPTCNILTAHQWVPAHTLRIAALKPCNPHNVSLANVSVDSQIFAPLSNLLMGVPCTLRRHRLPTGEKGKEELRHSVPLEGSRGELALKYILLWSEGVPLGLEIGVLAGVGPLYCRS